MSSIDDEVRKAREKMLEEKRKQEEAAAIQKRLDDAFAAAKLNKYSRTVVMPPAALQPVIQEVLPSLKFNKPKYIKTMPNGITYMRDTEDRERPTDRSFDVVYNTYTQDKSTYTQSLSIFRNGSVSTSGIDINEIDPQKLRTKIIETLASDSIKGGSSGKSGSSGSSSGGCYVATAVYGSYDCPEVWVLRRYRDYVLLEKPLGRAFVKLYYTVSPVMVRWFGRSRWFSSVLRPVLDRKVSELKAAGYKDTEYQDRI
jgi:hypothetical protein